jgi:hypothetical protein
VFRRLGQFVKCGSREFGQTFLNEAWYVVRSCLDLAVPTVVQSPTALLAWRLLVSFQPTSLSSRDPFQLQENSVRGGLLATLTDVAGSGIDQNRITQPLKEFSWMKEA